ncbi:hypothetical protein F1737_03905 [Methanoplanus sp. FWC-SCC4]|uniref:Uncharacterized protein n=1 Tax=Methanochimaera problematica TaxID=2609417 RepID=A0AA97I3W1_9EURY|nr:hypothetical protein [Methanoplanus sp. FWC-SCC4]WOF15899.1 hypothetical protein F1737_03905 [Methanoplanus sp. FWC-SCC4]
MKVWIISVLILIFSLSVLISGCTAQNEVVYDQTVTIPDGQDIEYDLLQGTYKITITSDTDIDILFDTASNYDEKGTKSFSKDVVLNGDTKMTVKNWALIGLGSEAIVQVLVVKNPTN